MAIANRVSRKEYESLMKKRKVNFFAKEFVGENISDSKYHSNKIVVDDILFHSEKEAERYKDLKVLEKLGLIQNLELQKTFVLIPSQKNKEGKVIERPCTYRADFCYQENGEQVVEDTKGYKTKDYIIKRKLMRFIHGISIREI